MCARGYCLTLTWGPIDIDRVSEDVVGFTRIMDACSTYFEVNADISHYVYRGIKKGSALGKILARVGACTFERAS